MKTLKEELNPSARDFIICKRKKALRNFWFVNFGQADILKMYILKLCRRRNLSQRTWWLLRTIKAAKLNRVSSASKRLRVNKNRRLALFAILYTLLSLLIAYRGWVQAHFKIFNSDTEDSGKEDEVLEKRQNQRGPRNLDKTGANKPVAGKSPISAALVTWMTIEQDDGCFSSWQPNELVQKGS